MAIAPLSTVFIDSFQNGDTGYPGYINIQGFFLTSNPFTSSNTVAELYRLFSWNISDHINSANILRNYILALCSIVHSTLNMN